MARPKNKVELLQAANDNFDKLMTLVDSMTEEQLNETFDFDESSGKEAHWLRDKNVRDVLIHLYEWHQLIINWIDSNQKGENKSFLPEGYTWASYAGMNVGFWEKHQTTDFGKAKEMVISSHKKVLTIIESFTDDELFTKKFYAWTGTTSLGSYFVSATSSHYDWALKKLRKYIKPIKYKK